MFKFNDTTPKKIKFNSLNVAKLVFNNVVVWLEKILKNVTGYPAILENSTGDDLVNYRIYGNSIQDGTPSPDSPVKIESVGDKTKNLLKYPYYDKTKTEKGVTYTDNSDGSITVSGTATDYSDFVFVRKMDISDYQNKNLIFSLNAINNVNIVAGFTLIGSDGSTIVSSQSSANNLKITLNEEAKYLTIYIKRNNNNQETGGVFKPQLELGTTATEYEPYGYKIPVRVVGKNLLNSNITTLTLDGVTYDNVIITPQLEVGAVATEYESYVEPITTNIFLDEPLRKIGDYSDYIDFKNQKVVRKIGKHIVTGKENKWFYNENYTTDTVLCMTARDLLPNLADIPQGFTTKFQYNSDSKEGAGYRFSLGRYLFISLDKTIAETLEEGKEIIAETEVYYVLEMQTEENISLPNIPTYKNLITIIETVTATQPSNIVAEYYAQGGD